MLFCRSHRRSRTVLGNLVVDEALHVDGRIEDSKLSAANRFADVGGISDRLAEGDLGFAVLCLPCSAAGRVALIVWEVGWPTYSIPIVAFPSDFDDAVPVNFLLTKSDLNGDTRTGTDRSRQIDLMDVSELTWRAGNNKTYARDSLDQG